MKKIGFCLALLMLCSFLSAAKFSAKQLYLEVNLTAEPVLTIKPTITSSPITVSESEGFISRSFSGAFSISVMNPEALSYYGVLAKQELSAADADDSLAVTREFFAWEQGKLKIKQELLHFLPVSFSDKPSAEAYALSHKIPKAKVMEVHMINSTVKITDSSGESLYLETPLTISSPTELSINGNSLGYEGEFVVKTVNRKLVLNHYLPLEDYLAGVVQNEIGNSSPLGALKAQAVAARTHALSLLLNNRHKADGYDLCHGTHCQVYKGKYLQNSLVMQAVTECAGEALFLNGSIADATYHSSCGGKTDASSAIWKGKPLAHLNGVTCVAEADSLDLSTESDARKWIDFKQDSSGMSSWERGAMSWEKSISTKQLAQNAGLNKIKWIELVQRGRSGRIISLNLIGDKTLKLDNEYEIRQVFGNLFSSFFYIKGNYNSDNGTVSIIPPKTLQLKGKGAGHGVGMCQVGALRMARQGLNYHEILAHYYPGTTLSKDWMND